MERGNKDFKRGARWARGGCLKKEGGCDPLTDYEYCVNGIGDVIRK